MEGYFPSSDLHRHPLSPSLHSLTEALTGSIARVESLAPPLQPVPGCSKGPSGSLFGHLVVAGTRILSWHRGHIKGFSSLAPEPKQVPPLGIDPRALPQQVREHPGLYDPRACPSRSMSILAFKGLVSWEEGRFGGCSPSQCPQPGFPAMHQGAYGDSGILTTHQPPGQWVGCGQSRACWV